MNPIVINARLDTLGTHLNGHRFASLFSSPEWIEVLARTYNIEVLASVPGNRRGKDAILFSHIRDVRGDRVVCLPFSDYCDPLVSDTSSWNELIEPLLTRNAPVKLRCLRNDLPAQDARFAL